MSLALVPRPQHNEASCGRQVLLFLSFFNILPYFRFVSSVPSSLAPLPKPNYNEASYSRQMHFISSLSVLPFLPCVSSLAMSLALLPKPHCNKASYGRPVQSIVLVARALQLRLQCANDLLCAAAPRLACRSPAQNDASDVAAHGNSGHLKFTSCRGKVSSKQCVLQ